MMRGSTSDRPSGWDTAVSIIDFSTAGHQPMSNEDETIWLVFNDEIYDFEPLRSELESKGYMLMSRTDCETVIHLHEEEGISGLRRLNGMFAFALLDVQHQWLFLARDRLGISPLRFAFLPSNDIFSLK